MSDRPCLHCVLSKALAEYQAEHRAEPEFVIFNVVEMLGDILCSFAEQGHPEHMDQAVEEMAKTIAQIRTGQWKPSAPRDYSPPSKPH